MMSSTQRDSFKGHDDRFEKEVMEGYKSDKNDYQKNKERSTAGGDWWGASAIQQEEDPKRSVRGMKHRSDPAPSISSQPQQSFLAATTSAHDAEWNQFRRKKPAEPTPLGDGLKYDIVSGIQKASGASVYNENMATASAQARVLWNARESERNGGFNIISHLPNKAS
ncbi:hypothetical protein BJ742DRAFT_804192 [Cladochytrium replicatum]|nr:hypothetical protein BJ742DRAFT_804192 [Cladochytrium replicatum]